MPDRLHWDWTCTYRVPERAVLLVTLPRGGSIHRISSWYEGIARARCGRRRLNWIYPTVEQLRAGKACAHCYWLPSAHSALFTRTANLISEI